MYFNAKREEGGAIKAFQLSTVASGLRLYISNKSLQALRSIVEAKVNETEPNVSEHDATILIRRGLIRYAAEGYVITEIGLLVIALGEAGGLVSIKGKLIPIKATK